MNKSCNQTLSLKDILESQSEQVWTSWLLPGCPFGDWRNYIKHHLASIERLHLLVVSDLRKFETSGHWNWIPCTYTQAGAKIILIFIKLRYYCYHPSRKLI